MKIGIKAGHTLTSGAVGLVKESDEVRKITRAVTPMLRQMGHEVVEVIVDTGNASAALLSGISQLNAAGCDLVLEIHLNACVQDYKGDGRTTGTETYIYADASAGKKYAQGIVDAIAALGYKNRGVKVNKSLTFLAKTTVPAVLVECFFCDDKDDVELYNVESMAAAIVKGITGNAYQASAGANGAGQAVPKEPVVEPEENQVHGEITRVQVGAYQIRENAIKMQATLKKAGFDAILVQG